MLKPLARLRAFSKLLFTSVKVDVVDEAVFRLVCVRESAIIRRGWWENLQRPGIILRSFHRKGSPSMKLGSIVRLWHFCWWRMEETAHCKTSQTQLLTANFERGRWQELTHAQCHSPPLTRRVYDDAAPNPSRIALALALETKVKTLCADPIVCIWTSSWEKLIVDCQEAGSTRVHSRHNFQPEELPGFSLVKVSRSTQSCCLNYSPRFCSARNRKVRRVLWHHDAFNRFVESSGTGNAVVRIPAVQGFPTSFLIGGACLPFWRYPGQQSAEGVSAGTSVGPNGAAAAANQYYCPPFGWVL